MAENQTLQIIRIGALLAVIFASGIVIGRFSKPEPAPLVIEAVPLELSIDRAVSIMSNNYGFDAEKEAKFRLLMERMEAEMRQFEAGTTERRDVWRRYLPEIRSFIPEEFMDQFLRKNRRTERQFERRIRQREAANGEVN